MFLLEIATRYPPTPLLLATTIIARTKLVGATKRKRFRYDALCFLHDISVTMKRNGIYAWAT